MPSVNTLKIQMFPRIEVRVGHSWPSLEEKNVIAKSITIAKIIILPRIPVLTKPS